MSLRMTPPPRKSSTRPPTPPPPVRAATARVLCLPANRCMRCVRYQVYQFRSRVYNTGCIITTGCSIAVGLLIDTWNIGWNCLGGGIQYLLPTMIEPYGNPVFPVQPRTVARTVGSQNHSTEIGNIRHPFVSFSCPPLCS